MMCESKTDAAACALNRNMHLFVLLFLGINVCFAIPHLQY